MLSSKWYKVLVPSYQGGMNSVIKAAMSNSHYSYLLENKFFKTELTVHAYREIGTAVEAAIEIRFLNDKNKIISTELLNIHL